jgi:hypothetical protein
MSLPSTADATAPREPSSPILRACVALQVASVAAVDRVRSARTDDRGQSTAEYALVILGAAAVALLLVAWASQTDKIGQLLDAVIDSILSRFR